MHILFQNDSQVHYSCHWIYLRAIMRFRRAGGFWNVAPGLPPGVIRDRILEIERVLVRAYLYEERREEVMGALRFCALLRAKFFRDLKLLQVTLPDLDLPEA